MPGWDLAQDIVNPHNLRMFEGTFSLDAAHLWKKELVALLVV